MVHLGVSPPTRATSDALASFGANVGRRGQAETHGGTHSKSAKIAASQSTRINRAS